MITFQNDNLCIFRSLLYETNSIVVQTEDLVLVVDPTWLPHEVEEIRQYVQASLHQRPLYLLFTHSDFDHILGYNAFPEAKVIASKALEEKTKLEQFEILEQIKAFDDEYYLVREYDITYPSVDWTTSQDGDTFKIGNTVLYFYQAPGHNSDGIFTIIEPLGLFITGDYFSNVEFPYIYQSSFQYEDSILKLDGIIKKHSIKMMIPGHGNFTTDLHEMKKRQTDSFMYIHEMRKRILNGNQPQIDQLIEGCKFPRNMRKFHRNNQLLFEKERQKYEFKSRNILS